MLAECVLTGVIFRVEGGGDEGSGLEHSKQSSVGGRVVPLIKSAQYRVKTLKICHGTPMLNTSSSELEPGILQTQEKSPQIASEEMI